MTIRINRSPGIAGIIGAKHSTNSMDDVDVMLKRLSYGDRTVSGIHSDNGLELHVGWVQPRNYSGAHFPIWNQDKSLGLIILGEIYHDEPEHDENSDRVWHHLLRCYEREGLGAVGRLNGWFGGLLLDQREKRVILFNDRYGLFRIHYHRTSDGLYFSSEAKAILAAVPATRQLDLKSLAELMSCGCTLQDRSMFSGISLLPGGSAWTFQPHQRTRQLTYFEASVWEEQSPLQSLEYYEQLKQTWIRLLPRYFRGDKAGVSLTGGVDSRMILAWGTQGAGELPCYTFAGRYRDSMDIRVAREVARVCGQPHETIYVDGNFLSEFPDLAENTIFLSDGTMDVTGSIDLYVQTVARQIAPIRVTGTNGGEIMRSLVAFKPGGVSFDPFPTDFVNLLRAAEVAYSNELCEPRLSFTAFKQVPWYMNTKFTVERSQITLRMPYFDNDLVSLVYRAPKDLPQNNDIALKLIADGNPRLAAIGTDRGLAFQTIPCLTTARHLWHQFTFKLEYAYDYGMPHWLAKIDHLLSPLQIEKHVLGRHKFHHFRVWYRNELAGYLKEVLLDGRTIRRPYLRGQAIERMVKDHISGTMNYTREFHKIIASELIQRQFIEQT